MRKVGGKAKDEVGLEKSGRRKVGMGWRLIEGVGC